MRPYKERLKTAEKTHRKFTDFKKTLVQYRGGKCEVCGYDRCLDALVFHHEDPARKDFQVSSVRKLTDIVLTELDKCSLLCANCHAEEHHRLRQESRYEELDMALEE